MEAIDRARRRIHHPFAGQTFRVERGPYVGKFFTLEDWALNVIPVPGTILNENGVDLLYGKIDGHGKMIAPQDIALPLFAIPDPEC